MYSVLSSLISLSTSKESEMLLLTGSYYSDCKDLRKHLKKMRTWQPNWGTPIGAYKYIYRAHSAVFSAAEYTFQSTQLGFPNWGFLPCTCNSEWPNWGDDPIGVTTQLGSPNWGGFLNRKSFLIDVMPYINKYVINRSRDTMSWIFCSLTAAMLCL